MIQILLTFNSHGPKIPEEVATVYSLEVLDIDFFEGLIKPKKFNDNIKGLTIYAEEKNIYNEFKNIYIKKKDSNEKFQITFAKKGIFELKGNKRILVLYNGQTLNSNNNKITNFQFSKSDYGLSSMDSHLVTHKKTKEQSTISLINCLNKVFNNKSEIILNCDNSNISNIYKELFKRLIAPLYFPLLILISLLFILISKEDVKFTKYKYLIF